MNRKRQETARKGKISLLGVYHACTGSAMVIRKIEARRVLHRGEYVWLVRTPKDLRGAQWKDFSYYKNEKDANAHVARLIAARSSLFGSFLRHTQPEQAALLRMLDSLGADNLLKAGEMFHDLQRRNVPIIQVAQEYLASVQQSNARESYVISLRILLNQFERSVGVKTIGELTTPILQAWLNGNGWAAPTRAGYLSRLTSLCEFAVRRKYVTENVAAAISVPHLTDTKPSVLTVDQVRRLLQKTQELDPKLLRYFVMILFAGLRSNEALHASRLASGNLEVVGEHAKKRARRIVEPNKTARAWLEVAPDVTRWRNLANRRRAVVAAAKIPWPHNCLRHSFCSYAFPIFGARVTAEAAGHSEAVLFKHYRELVTKEEAEKFWALRPNKQTKEKK